MILATWHGRTNAPLIEVSVAKVALLSLLELDAIYRK